MARQSPTWWSLRHRSASSPTSRPPGHAQLEPPTKKATFSYGSESGAALRGLWLRSTSITDVANYVVSEVLSDPAPLLPGVQHGQTSPGHLAKLDCFLVGEGPVEGEGVTTRTNLVEAIAPAVYLVV